MFIPAEIIKKKRNGFELSEDELKSFLDGFMAGTVTDYQMTAFLMAVYFQSMTLKEATFLTQLMLNSGSKLDFSHLNAPVVDKHSTGGIGDKTSLVIAPIAACAGIKVPMMSGRGLGHTGGTLDKLESLPGFDTQLNIERFQKQVAELGLAFIGQTKEICPADKRMYSLRDVTGTVESLPLICGSILSKKLAEGLTGLVMDVKWGSGAFMKTSKDATKLAQWIIDIAGKSGLRTTALITDMNQPLGNAVGNSLEVQECLDIMSGSGPSDLRTLCLELAAHMIWIGKKTKTLKEAFGVATEILDSGRALKLFEKVVATQGGSMKLPKARAHFPVISKQKGFVQSIQTEGVGLVALALGAGRKTVTDSIDYSAGLVVHKKIGDKVDRGEAIATFYFNDKPLSFVEDLQKTFLTHYKLGSAKKAKPKLVFKTLIGRSRG